MRLTEIKKHINIAIENFNPIFNNESSRPYIDNALMTKVVIRNLHDAGIIEINPNETDNILTIISSCMTDRIIIDHNKFNEYRYTLKILNESLIMLSDWINRYVPDEKDETVINIKLPQLNGMDDLIKASTIINKSLGQSVSEVGGEVKVKHLEYGSSWIIISVGIAAAANLVMRIANAAFEISKKYYSFRITQKQYERYSISTDIIKNIKEVNEKIIYEETNKLAEDIEKDFYDEKDNERISRIRVSIAEMMKLIELGGEVHPALIESSNKQIQTPDYKSLLGVIKSIAEFPRNENDKTEEKGNDLKE